MSKFVEASSYKWLALAAVECAIFLLGVDATIVNVALPTITEDLRVDIHQTQWIVSIFLISTALLLPIMGRVADIVGRKIVFVGGIGHSNSLFFFLCDF